MPNITDQAAPAVEGIAKVVGYGGSGTAVYFGLSPGEWQAVGIIGGLIVGFLGFVGQMVISVYFKSQHLKLAQAKSEANADE